MNWKVRDWGSLHWHNFRVKIKIRSETLKLKHAVRVTDTAERMLVHFMHIMERLRNDVRNKTRNIVTYWGFCSRRIFISAQKLNKLQLHATSNSPNTVGQYLSVNFFCNTRASGLSDVSHQSFPDNKMGSVETAWHIFGGKWWHCCVIMSLDSFFW
jgi:hypothetical protein